MAKKSVEDAPNKLLLVDREKFRLRLYRRADESTEYEQLASYKIAVGADGFKTPRGAYVINTKVEDPAWTVPNSDWAVDAGLIPGTVVKGGATENPIKERWLGVTDPSDGVGIHGTAKEESIGTRASHGCIRMNPEDVIELYDKVPIGTPVVVV